MKKFIGLTVIVLLAFTAGVLAQATVNLFPDVQVSSDQRAKAVWAVCYTTNYTGAWDDGPAMWAHYRSEMVDYLKMQYKIAKHREALNALPDEDSYDLDE